MPRLPKLSLSFLIPACFIILYLGLVSGEYFYEHAELNDQLALRQSEQIQKDLFRMSHVIESSVMTQDFERIEQEVALVSTDQNMMAYVILDSASDIKFANHIIWRESNAINVLEGYSADKHSAAIGSNKPNVTVNFERLSIQAYYPLNSNSRFSYSNTVELIYLEYDIANLLSEATESLLKRFIEIWGLGAIVLTLFCILLHYAFIRPLSQLSHAAKNIDKPDFNTNIICVTREMSTLRDYLNLVKGRLYRSQKRLNDAEQRWLFAVEGARNGIWDWAIATGDVFVSDRWKEILGYQPYELDNDYSVWESRLHREDKPQVLNTLQNYINNQHDEYESVHRLRHKDGRYIWVLDRGKIVEWDELGRPLRIIGTITDVSGDVKSQRISVDKPNHNGLTDLINREVLADQLYDLQVLSRKTGQFSALLMINLDNFKLINDALGRQLGDRLLMQIAARLSGSFSSAGTVARLGADEFVILAKNFGHDIDQANKRALALASEVRQLIGRGFTISEQNLSITARVGLVVFDGIESLEPQVLLARADSALDQAKDSRSNGCAIYQPELDQQHVQPIKLQSELKLAIHNKQMSLVYQPVVDHTGQLNSVEVLMRWYHPQFGYISPRKFIAAAEVTDYIFEIELWALDQVLLLINSLQQMNSTVPVMSLNISSRHFHQDHFAHVVMSRISATYVSPKLLQFEIAEDIFKVNADDARNKIIELQAYGINIAMDDFGGGSCGVHQLQGISFSQVKLAAVYLEEIEYNPEIFNIVNAIVEFANKLNLPVVAKQIENKKQLNLLTHAKCTGFQGYIISRPLDKDDITQLIKTQLSLSVAP
ncbi:putative bifunctional diguanylate cyclase/phosphodiesterase [Shewanella phaeophyticola]|uniref:GGDEF and EAL domain-containing protein n=1 Tax=Shewanella phaeophyticola TaxID=2978345 RepID=A0ABT2P881_9GAMM|nr:GGDEF and EAL domain-containing protein [Shewanella sp. KJ10-1]MCT8988234.1 GGDEF and EAL domain-containing protein [Shewanella sp. KJ10-1]